MKILAIDTTTKFLCLGIHDNGKNYEFTLETGKKLSLLLVDIIHRALEALNTRVSDIDYFACGLGPGSFTGIRVGVSTIKGLSWSLKKPVVGVATLDLLARNAGEKEGYIVPAIDAKRSLIYCSIYQKKGKNLKRISPYLLLSQEEFFRKINPHSLILGDAAGVYGQQMLKNIKGVSLLDKDYWYPKPDNLIDISLEKIKARKLNNAFNVKPIYLYPKECQVKKTK